MTKQVRSLGWVWLVLSPLLFLMAAISSVKSDLTYNIQLVCFGLVAIVGLIGSVALLFGHSLWLRILRSLSWLGFIYFTGAALLVPVFHVLNAEVTLASLGFVALIAALIGVFGIPFLGMARRLGNPQQGAAGDGPRPEADPDPEPSGKKSTDPSEEHRMLSR